MLQRPTEVPEESKTTQKLPSAFTFLIPQFKEWIGQCLPDGPLYSVLDRSWIVSFFKFVTVILVNATKN